MPSFLSDSDPIPDTIPLSTAEQTLKVQLEAIVENGLDQFLAVGQALCQLRDRRLYRRTHATFASYVADRFGLARSSVDSLIRASSVAQSLLDAGEVLPPNTKPTLIRPIAALPSTELQTACWSLVRAVSPGRDPTEPLVSKVCRLVRNCLENGDDEGESVSDNQCRVGRHHRKRTPIARETPFVRPVIRLDTWHGFNAELVTAHISQSDNAQALYRACGILADRCREVQQRLSNRFPQLENSRCPAPHELNASDA